MTDPFDYREGAQSRTYELIKRDTKIGSPTFGQDLLTIKILGPNKSNIGVCMGDNFSGFYHAPRTPVRESWAYQEGSTPSDFPRVDERIIDFRLITRGRTAREWETVENYLWEVLSFTEDCVLRVTSQRSVPRELKIRLDRKPADTFKIDPGSQHMMVWSITAVACDPWWYSAPLTDSVKKSEMTEINGSTGAPQAGTGIFRGYVTIENKADQESWLQWSNAQIAVAETWTLPDGVNVYTSGANTGKNVTHQLPKLNPGQEFLVNTHPLAETLMVRDDTQKWAEMAAEDFQFSLKKRTPSTNVPVRLTGGTANSEVKVYMIQRWDRPYGGEDQGWI